MYAILNDRITIDGSQKHTLDALNPPGVFQGGVRQREYSTQDILPMSGKLIPEFSGRRNIRDMFSKRPTGPSSRSVAPPTDDSLKFNTSKDLDLEQAIQASLVSSTETPISDSSKETNASSKPQPSPIAGSKRAASKKLASRSLKRSKSGSTAGINAPAATDKGQKSLKGFFKPKSSRSSSPSRKANGKTLAPRHEMMV